LTKTVSAASRFAAAVAFVRVIVPIYFGNVRQDDTLLEMRE
jgi:hypothetical protein